MSDLAIRAEALVVRHRGRDGSRVVALDGVSLDVSRGECVAVVGPSGAGKSTLARALLALQPIDAGRVAWFRAARELDATRAKERERRPWRAGFQLVLQDPGASLDPRRDVRAVLAEALAAHARIDRRTIESRSIALLADVGLAAEHLERLPHQLSGGERQRVCIARALAVEPDVLVLDEPVAMLDALVEAQILDLLVELRARRGLGYVLVAHDLALVRWIADRVVVLDRGRIVEQGTPAEVLDAPRHATTRALVEARASLG